MALVYIAAVELEVDSIAVEEAGNTVVEEVGNTVVGVVGRQAVGEVDRQVEEEAGRQAEEEADILLVLVPEGALGVLLVEQERFLLVH